MMASRIIAVAAFLEGYQVQTFPEFGVERRGAPVTAYLRIDQSKIYLRIGIRRPDHIIVLEPTLFRMIDVLHGLKEGGWVIVNTSESPKQLGINRDCRVATINAIEIAVAQGLGTRTMPMINTAIVGAYGAVTGLISVGAIEEAIRQTVPVKIESNIKAAKLAYEQVCILEG